jgi:hypothetical protein
MVVSLIALFISVGGGAYAAINLPPNNVGARQLKNGAITPTKIQNGAVTNSKIQNGPSHTQKSATARSPAQT